ncbi:MAG: pyruvate dehydrogenase (acetyl-transferring) E1 component subunit alpha [Geobacteraceae bacterium GWC2_53_11]|nr:MAG: pyruvate dehydrogenase (acetyl-transferring) E1 component subunit alpha [Geobacteraceae bacterium GWC2_53_11]
MSNETIVQFRVERLSILDENGVVDESLMPSLPDAEILRMYECMVLARTFDQRAVALQREGRLGTYPPSIGQEAAQVGSAFALQPTDWVFPSFREMGVQLTLGYPIRQLFQYWAGDERGQHSPQELNIFPISVSVGTHIPHAVGAAMAARYRRDPVAVIAYFGDGATSKGDFHEGFNMAGLFRLPVVFICQNNQWAISVPLSGQTAAQTLAQKAVAYGFEGVQVDGNDVFAVYRATRDALEKARSGGGATFIECLTYRMADHTTSDDAGRYRSAGDVAAWSARDPLLRLERFMTGRGLWNEQYQTEIRERATAEVDAGIAAMEAEPLLEAAAMFDHTCAALSPRQVWQREGL